MPDDIDIEPTASASTELAACVERFVSEHRCVGVAVGVVRGASDLTVIARGAASLDDDRPVNRRSIFRAGSITKLFTAIAVMQLVEDETLALDEPATSFLHSFELRSCPEGPEITLRHLLTHTSGLGELRRPSDLMRPMVGLATKSGTPVPSLAEYYGPRLTAESPAGDRWAYANHGFGTLGAIVEDVTGEAFAARVRRTILEPLEMTHSDIDRIDTNLCDGYSRRFDRIRHVDHVDVIPAPAGSLFTCVEDMAAFIRMVCGHGPGVLDPLLLGEMMAPEVRLHPGLPAMGLAFWVDDCGSRRMVTHDGGMPGFISHLRIAPDDDAGLVIFTNLASPRIAMDIGALGEELMEISLGSDQPKFAPDRRDLWPGLCGAYRLEPGLNVNARPWALLGGEVEVLLRDGELMIRSFIGPLRAPHRLRPADADDPAVFTVAVGALSVRVAFGPEVIHVGLPLNVTLHRRTDSFRQRARIGGLAAAATAIAAISARTG